MNWKKFKLGDVLKRRRETVRILPDKDYKLVTIKLYHKGVILRSISKGSEIKSTMSSVKEGDFILSGIDARNGAFGIVPPELNGAVVTNDFWCLDPDEKLIDKDFLLFLTGTQFFDYICKQSSDGTTQRIRLQREKFFNYEIDLPSTEEQKRLVRQLKLQESKSVYLSSELIHQLDLVKQLRQAFLREAMQGKLVPQDRNDEPASELLKKIKAEKEQLIKEKKRKNQKEIPPIKLEEIPFEIPENWVWCRLGELVNIKSGKRIHASDYRIEGVPFLRSGEIGTLGRGEKIANQLFISEKKYNEIKSNFGIPNPGDILIACIGGSIGNTWVVDNRQFYYKDGNLVLIECIPEVLTQYLLSYLKGPFFWDNTIMNATDSSYNALTIVKLDNSEFPLPPFSEQHRIVTKLEQLMHYCDELEQSIKQSQAQNEQLLQQVLREALQPKEYKQKSELSLTAEPN